jgi:hypothetical protein
VSKRKPNEPLDLEQAAPSGLPEKIALSESTPAASAEDDLILDEAINLEEMRQALEHEGERLLELKKELHEQSEGVRMLKVLRDLYTFASHRGASNTPQIVAARDVLEKYKDLLA